MKIKSYKSTILRSVLVGCIIANHIVAVLRATSFASQPAYQIGSIVLTIIMSVITVWKNNDFTYLAQLGSGIMHVLEDAEIVIEELKILLNERKRKKTPLKKNNNE